MDINTHVKRYILEFLEAKNAFISSRNILNSYKKECVHPKKYVKIRKENAKQFGGTGEETISLVYCDLCEQTILHLDNDKITPFMLSPPLWRLNMKQTFTKQEFNKAKKNNKILGDRLYDLIKTCSHPNLCILHTTDSGGFLENGEWHKSEDTFYCRLCCSNLSRKE